MWIFKVATTCHLEFPQILRGAQFIYQKGLSILSKKIKLFILNDLPCAMFTLAKALFVFNVESIFRH